MFVTAPDNEFRRSIAFALEAEDFDVMPFPALRDAVDAAQKRAAACIVIDEQTIEWFGNGWQEVEGLKMPKILLSAGLRTIPPLADMTVLLKPLLGRHLVDAVSEAINEYNRMVLRRST